jgi:hypothetical protein
MNVFWIVFLMGFLVPLVLVTLSLFQYRRQHNIFFVFTAIAYSLEFVGYVWQIFFRQYLTKTTSVFWAAIYLISFLLLTYGFATFSSEKS